MKKETENDKKSGILHKNKNKTKKKMKEIKKTCLSSEQFKWQKFASVVSHQDFILRSVLLPEQ